jgi:hypothetical protein
VSQKDPRGASAKGCVPPTDGAVTSAGDNDLRVGSDGSTAKVLRWRAMQRARCEREAKYMMGEEGVKGTTRCVGMEIQKKVQRVKKNLTS